jgi:serine/threonine protein kinase
METKPEVRSGDKPPAANPVPKRPSGSVAAAPSKPAFPYEDLLGKQPENLAGYLKDDPAQHDDVINAFVATVDAVARLHAAKARVEPLTPQSICFDKMGKVTIVNSQATGSATTSVVVGNPRYAVPEIFSEKAAGGESNIPAAHVYALGFMFYEIMLGRQLFEKTFAQQRSEIEWLRWHADLESKAPAVKSLLPGCPDTLSELLASMIEKHTEKRAADLQAITASLRDIARRSNKTVVMMRKPPANEPMRKLITPAKPAPKPKKKSSATLFIVLLFILVLAAAAFYMWQNPELYQGLLSHFSHRAPAP